MEYQIILKLDGLTFDPSGERFLFADGTEAVREETGWTLRRSVNAPEKSGG